ncbi:MAG: rod shape-determining protein MreD [Bdellovibrionales bacterium]
MEAFWQRLDFWFRASVPSLSTLLMTLLDVSAGPIPHLEMVLPPLGFMSLFYWSAHRPDLFPPAVAFSVGLLSDIINGGPLGLSALLFTAAHQIIWRQRSLFAGHSFYMLWSGFSLVVLIFIFTQWALRGLLEWHLARVLPVLMQAVLAIILFPLLCWLFIRLQRITASAN